jgi:hypothetical protein
MRRDPRFDELDAAIAAETPAHRDRDHIFAKRRRRQNSRSASLWRPVKCWHCGAADSRDAKHARGCPQLDSIPEEEVYRMQREYMATYAPKEIATGAAA